MNDNPATSGETATGPATYRRDLLETAHAVHADAPHLARFLDEIRSERAAQIAKWGDQRHPDGTGDTPDYSWAKAAQFHREKIAAGDVNWRLILSEEVYEAFSESDPVRLRAELVQVAAVCAAWISDLDRRLAEPVAPDASGPVFGLAEIPPVFRIGDLVEITGRDGGEVCASSGANLNGKTGVVAEIDDNPEYPIGLRVEGFVGLVWCASTEIRHADRAGVATSESVAGR